jgi:hypothetical protein
MISEHHIRGNADMSEESRMFCAGAMISVGLFLAVICVALRGAHMNVQNMLALLDKMCERYDAWANPRLLPIHSSSKATDASAVSVLLIPHLAELGKGSTTSIRLPHSLSAGNLRIRSPPMTPQFTDRTDLFSVQQKPTQDV